MKVKDLIAELAMLDPEMPVAKRNCIGMSAVCDGELSGFQVVATLPTEDNRNLKLAKEYFKPAVYPNIDYLTIPEEE